MRYQSVVVAASMAAVVFGAFGAHAQQVAGQAPLGFADPVRDRVAIQASKARILDTKPQEPFFKAADVSHVASGVALRGRAGGVIRSRGVPAGGKVVQSFLFWNFSDGKKEAPSSSPALLNGNLVIGRKTADNSDPCWLKVGNHSYVADVTAWTNQTGGSNQEYDLVLPFWEDTDTSGANPFNTPVASERILEGASLVVIYKSRETKGALYVFAPTGDNMFFTTAKYFLPAPGAGTGLLTMMGADGQRGGGHDNGSSNELSLFGGTQIAGPPIAAADWDGSDGLTLPQLWDTHTHVVKMSKAIEELEYQSTGDCLVPVGFVLDLE